MQNAKVEVGEWQMRGEAVLGNGIFAIEEGLELLDEDQECCRVMSIDRAAKVVTLMYPQCDRLVPLAKLKLWFRPVGYS